MVTPYLRSRGGGGGGGPVPPVFPVARRPGVGAELFHAPTGPTACVSAVFPAFGAWAAVGVPLAADLYLTRLQTRRILIPNAGGVMVAEWSYGVANVPLDVIRGVATIQDPTADATGWMPWDLNTYGTRLPAGQQLYVRISDPVAAGVNYEAWVTGWSGAIPVFTSIGQASAAGAGRYYPGNVAAGINVPSAAYPAYGAWTQIVAAAPNNMLVTHVGASSAAVGNILVSTAYQIGIGAAGLEVECGTFITGHAIQPVNCDPPVLVLAGERLAVRASSGGAANRATVVKVIDL